MSPSTVLEYASFGIVVCGVVLALLEAGFRPKARSWRFKTWVWTAVAFVGARVFVATSNDRPAEWWGAFVWVHLLVVMVVWVVVTVYAIIETERNSR